MLFCAYRKTWRKETPKRDAFAPLAVPEKIIGLTLILDFFDRCDSFASLHPPLAALGLLPPLETLGMRRPTPRTQSRPGRRPTWSAPCSRIAHRRTSELLIRARWGIAKGDTMGCPPWPCFSFATSFRRSEKKWCPRRVTSAVMRRAEVVAPYSAPAGNKHGLAGRRGRRPLH